MRFIFCPFCNGKKIKVIKSGYNDFVTGKLVPTEYRAECQSCWLISPAFRSREELLRYWNTRPIKRARRKTK